MRAGTGGLRLSSVQGPELFVSLRGSHAFPALGGFLSSASLRGLAPPRALPVLGTRAVGMGIGSERVGGGAALEVITLVTPSCTPPPHPALPCPAPNSLSGSFI